MRILPDHTVNGIELDSLAVGRPAQCTVAAKEGGWPISNISPPLPTEWQNRSKLTLHIFQNLMELAKW